YIGSLITTQAANEIKTNISRQLVEAYVQGIFSSLHELGDGMSQASAGAEELALGSEKLNLGINQYTDGVEKIATNQQTLSGGLTQLENGARQIQAGLKSTGDALPGEAQINQLKNGINSLQQGINILNSSVSNPSNELTAAQINLKTSSGELISSLSELEKNGAALQKVLEYASGQITGGGSATLTAEQIGIISSFAKTSSDVAEKSATLLNNLQTFSGLLQKQQETLQQGVSSLQSGANLVLPSTKTALSGYGVLRGANAELLNGSNSLVSGLVTANAGSRQLTNGANTLMQNSAQLKNGSLALNEGASTLSEKLAIAADQVQLQPTGEKTQAQIATPVASLEIEKGNVPNYGYALAPYVLSLGLFVGALVVNVIYPIRKDFSKKGGAVALWASKLSVAFVAAIVQATVLMAIMVWFLGLHPENPVHFVLAIYLTSIANMMIVTFLVIVFDNPGRFLAMLLLVLQLGASGGTFPIQTSPGFFQVINPFLPMTYSILALRQAISGGLPISIFNQSMWILVIISSLAIGALLLYYILQKKNHQQMI
ncbi:YhgE/Pip domain-containing protein, partial [Candidatus Saccharibacteria bacterium]|nr:YhgE/Pip domain-containing protein [Candidatus Saccharibacteria bacterium]